MESRFTLRELLEKHGISQSAIAQRAGLHLATVQRICANSTGQVSLTTLAKLVAALLAAGVKDAGVEDIIAVEPDKKRKRSA